MQAQACDSCHRRKSRCDKVRPACGYCQKNQARCVYTDRSREPTFRKHHIEAVERRLRQVETKNKALADELARLRATSELPERGDGISASRSAPTISSMTSGRSSASENTPAGGDVINEVSFLASTAAGERHYLGSTSGILFANLVRASVEVSNPNPPSSSSTNRDTQLHLDTSKYSSFLASKETLPLYELARKLVNAYLSHNHLCYPFLSPHALLSIVDSIYNDLSVYNDNAYEAFVFDLVLAIATANVYKFDWQMLPSAETHHTRAMSRIAEVFQAGGLKSLQAILLLCQYRTGSSMQDTSASMWHLVGIAVRISFELGLHRKSTYNLNKQGQGALDTLQDQEIRRRCFWCVFAMDRIVGITLGRPLAINLDDIDVELPSAENDHVLARPLERHEGNSPINRTAIFVHITEYRLLCGRIIKSLHGLKRPEHDERQIHALRDSLVADLDSWRQKTGSLGLSKMSQDQSSFTSHEWYEMLYCNAMLFLFRPSPMLSDITRDSNSLQNIFWSAKQSITFYAYLHRSRKINYSWITLHSVFMAGLSYIYSVSRHFRERRRGSLCGAVLTSDPSPIEIVNDTRACSNVLVAVSERWNALRNCHEVFDRLSDAVLADAIKQQRAANVIQPSSAAQSMLTPTSAQAAASDTNQTSSSGAYHLRAEGALSMGSDFYAGTSPLAVDSEFRSCFDDLQNLYDQSYVDDAVMQLSQDWLGYIDDFNTMPQMMPTQYTEASY